MGRDWVSPFYISFVYIQVRPLDESLFPVKLNIYHFSAC